MTDITIFARESDVAGHWLGMDTHDCPSQSQDQMLQPGVVMTLEPGLYIPDLER